MGYPEGIQMKPNQNIEVNFLTALFEALGMMGENPFEQYEMRQPSHYCRVV